MSRAAPLRAQTSPVGPCAAAHSNTVCSIIVRSKRQDFSGISLRGTSFAEADLEKADLSGCDLTETVFRNAQLKECDLRRAKFSRTDIRFAKMQKTKIDLEGAVYLAGQLGAVVN